MCGGILGRRRRLFRFLALSSSLSRRHRTLKATQAHYCFISHGASGLLPARRNAKGEKKTVCSSRFCKPFPAFSTELPFFLLLLDHRQPLSRPFLHRMSVEIPNKT
jgi:hypothetical protein